VHENTALYFKIKTNQINLPHDEESMALYRWTCDHLNQHNFKQYELSNFAIPGYESQHNQAYWDRVPYKGFGIGACSFDGKRRFCNEKDIKKYLDAMQNGENITEYYEELDETQAVLEHIMLNLRRPRGVRIRDIMDGMWRNKCNDAYELINQLEEQNFVERCGVTHLRLTSKGLVVENEVVAQLCRVAL
jgi:oxygen-independent coproporphyrinogen-3 oxidase